MSTRTSGSSDCYRQDLERNKRDRRGEKHNRAVARAPRAYGHGPLGQRQQAQLLQHTGERSLARLDHHQVARLEAHLRKPLAQGLALTADGEQLGAESVLKIQHAGGKADQRRARFDHRFDRAELLAGLLSLDWCILAHLGQRELLEQNAERFLLAFELQDHAGHEAC
jgi:hypothetical protein